MKKVLVILPYANKHLELFFRYIEKHYKVEYFVHGRSDQYRKNIKDNALKIQSIGYLMACKNLIKRKYEIVFTHGIFYPYLIFLHFSNRNTIIILSEGFRNNFEKGLKGVFKHLHIKRLTKNNNVNLFMLGDLNIKEQYEKLKPHKIQYFQYGMYPGLTSVLNTKSAYTNPVKFVFAGQFIPRKNIDLMLDSILQTPQFQTGEAEFTFIGEGPEADKINSNANVKLIATLSKESLLKVLSNSDVLVLVSSYEGWGAIINEASACGCVLIISQKVGAGTLFFKDNENGYIALFNKESLSNLFKLLIEDRKGLSKMKEASLKIFTSVYNEHDHNLSNIIAFAVNPDCLPIE